MSAPTVRAANGGGFGAGTSFSFVLPNSVSAGDVLVCACGAKGSTDSFTFPAGWTVTNDGLTNGSAVATKVADGTEAGTSITVTTTVSTSVAYVVWAVTSADKTIARAQNSGSLTPPALTSGFGAVATLWLTALFGATTSAGPAGYSDYRVWSTSGVTYCSSADTATTAGSEAPGAYTGTSAVNTACVTIALQATLGGRLGMFLGANF